MSWHHDKHNPHTIISPATLENVTKNPFRSDIERTFLHIDMDAFFASVEIRDNPALEGRPVAVGGSHGNRGVVTAANYIARKYGLKAGMTAVEARRRCPHAVFLRVRGEKYTYVSAQIMAALERFSPDMRPLSVDEASLEITGCLKLYGGAVRIGEEIKQLIWSKFRLPSTVGIGPNRLVAKMAANLGKPDGLLVIHSEEAAEVFAPLPVDKMIGIGKATTNALNGIGITTLGQLAKAPDRLLKSRFGILGPVMKKLARGEWSGRMRKDEDRGPIERSIGHQRTYGEPISDPAALKAKLVALAEMVARRVRRARMVGRVLTLTIRYTDFTTISHQSVLPVITDDEDELILHAWRLLNEALEEKRKVRLLGLSLGRLKSKEKHDRQLDIFFSNLKLKHEELHNALDNLRDRFGERVIARAMGGRWEPRK
ncbi:MAG: DNA polymerase IV [Candidatus Hatepunaea meridiana]|nr:DNA polymerase IV [Candidatus Hatepunaea meridiana]